MAYQKEVVPHVLTQIGRLSDAIKTEFDLVGLRMSWLVVSESFIFTAFAISVANYKTSNDLILFSVLYYLTWALPLLGMLMASLVYIAIIAAHRAIYDLKKQRDDMIGELEPPLNIKLIGNTSREHRMGNVPPWGIPPILFLAWTVALYMRLKP